jgi:hypothetical protein
MATKGTGEFTLNQLSIEARLVCRIITNRVHLVKSMIHHIRASIVPLHSVDTRTNGLCL